MLAIFLHNIINTSVPSNSQINNNLSICRKINEFIQDDYKLISLNVMSLFTSVPLELTLSSIERWKYIEKNSIPP